MPYCIHCGVKVNHIHSLCPLCNIPLEFTEKRKDLPQLYPNEINKISLIKAQINTIDNNLIIFLRFLSILIITTTCGLDYYLTAKLTWSLISSLSIIFVYIIITSVLHLKRNPSILYTYLNLTLGIFLYILDNLTSRGSWFIQFALPCFISLQLISLTAKILFKFIHDKILRCVTIILITNLFLVIINEITTKRISWSIFTSAIFLPTSIYLVYLFKLFNSKHHSH